MRGALARTLAEGQTKTPESLILDAGLQKLRPLLEPRGFRFDDVVFGASHGFGVFCPVVSDSVEIHVTVVDSVGIRSPSYRMRSPWGTAGCGHIPLLEVLGCTQAHLVPADSPHGLSYVAAGGGDPFDALVDDLQAWVLPAFDESETDFLSAIQHARDLHVQRMVSGSG